MASKRGTRFRKLRGFPALTLLDWNHSDFRTDEQDPPEILYHYTDACGLEGIVKDRCLRATHHRFLNDKGEVSFGFTLAREVLEKLEDAIGKELVALTREKILALESGESFIACALARHDTLSQWRAYANDGAGYCIGFTVEERTISAFAQDKRTGDFLHWGSLLLECIYGQRKIQRLLRERFSQQIDFVRRKGFDTTDKAVIEVLADRLSGIAWRYAQLAKHEHFKEEREWRFVIEAGQEQDKYFIGRLGLTPYRETDHIEIKEVWIGPSAGPDPEVMKRTLTRFLQKHGGADGVKFDVWNSPYVKR